VSAPWFDARRCETIRELCVEWMRNPKLPINAIPASADDVLWLLDSLEEARKLVVEADAFISHMLYRESWPGDRYDVERLIGRLRPASQAGR
jgi:hypothetical protein